jgi:Uma2 family endonuclease
MRNGAAVGAAPKVPLLCNGDHMLQPEFHRRYEACPEDFRAELIGGIVYVASPLRRSHGSYHFKLSLVLGIYECETAGVEGGDNLTTILDKDSEPQPDLLLRLLTENGGQSHYNADDYLVGAPELAVEIADSSRSIDLNRKRLAYLKAGVQEYLVYCVDEEEVHWFHFPSRRKLKADRSGVWKSRVFPGLWLHGPALTARNSRQLRATIEEGLATPEHAAFVRKLQTARRS